MFNILIFYLLSLYVETHIGVDILPYTWVAGTTPVLVMPNYTSLNYVFKSPSHILLRLLIYSLLALNAKLPSFYYSPLSTTAIFLHKNFTH